MCGPPRPRTPRSRWSPTAGLGFDLDTPEDIEVLPPGLLGDLLHLGQAALVATPRADGTAA